MSELAQSYWPKQGLYDPAFEHDACGVGFVANIRGEKSHDVVAEGHPGAREPRAPRRLRLRSRIPATAPAC